ncbi:hypothetical protein K450DRAFT_225728 [Umbelopsis ramanniana AG]|uniref:Uncharacterized protein n=1 Tax=Umbelopsis ramanniana AG TaxID=1314678 RepID=A0AAD5EH75_UMBRA|nr:uncharacterized protein K450DRAFT_225728 [Umbelopsis ramanniana AG]KAI8582980.1 hypothetical protein K450DRAFT_225728 [Umbelopsis ramanniana AG]
MNFPLFPSLAPNAIPSAWYEQQQSLLDMSEQLEHDEQELEEQLVRAGSASMHFKIIGARQNPYASDVDEQELQEHMSEADTEPAPSEDEGHPDPSTPDIMNQADEDDMNLPGLSDEEEEGLPIALL